MMKRFLILFLLCMGLGRQLLQADSIRFDQLEEQAFDYFWQTCDTNGLMPVRVGMPGVISIAGNGHLLNAICIGTERGWVKRDEAVASIHRQLDTLNALPRFHGFWSGHYDAATRQPTPFNHPLNDGADTLATATLAAGLITAEAYFNSTNETEQALRSRARELYSSIEWPWMLYNRNGDKENTLAAYWSPKHGFAMQQRLTADFNIGAMTAYLIAIASPKHPVPASTWYNGWCSTYTRATFQDMRFIECPPLAYHFLPHIWLDLSCRADREADYTRSATAAALANRHYALTTLYPGKNLWGISDCTGPHGFEHYGYPPLTGKVNADAIIAIDALIGALPFVPEDAESSLLTLKQHYTNQVLGEYGFYESCSPKNDWFFKGYSTAQQGLVLATLANRRDGLIQRTFMSNPGIRQALDQAGFHGIIANFEPTGKRFKLYSLFAPSRFYSCSLTINEDAREGIQALQVEYNKGYSADAALELFPQCRDFSGYRFISCRVHGLDTLALRLTDSANNTLTLAPPVTGPTDADNWLRLYFQLPQSASSADLTAIQSVSIIAEPRQTRKHGKFLLDSLLLVNHITRKQPETPHSLQVRESRLPGEIQLSWAVDPNAPLPYRSHVRYASSSMRNQKDFEKAVSATGAQGIGGSTTNISIGGLATGQEIYLAIQTEDLDGNLSDISQNAKVFLNRKRLPDEFPFENFDEPSLSVSIESPTPAIRTRHVTDVSLEGAGSLEVEYRQTGEQDRWAHLVIQPDIRNISDYNYLSMWIAGRAEISLRLIDTNGHVQDTPPQLADNLNSWAPLYFDLSKLDKVNRRSIAKILLFVEPGKTDIAGTIYIDSIMLNKTRN